MRRIFSLAIFVFVIASAAQADVGQVIKERNGKYIVSTYLGFSGLEWYGGGLIQEGDVLVGTLNSYGFYDVYNKTRNSENWIYIDDYMMSWDEALEWLYR